MEKVGAKCKVCKGTGKQHLTVHDPYGAFSNGEPTTKEYEITCVWCNGTGTMDEQALKEYEWNQTAWCRCEESSSQIFFDDGECECGCSKHHYHCRDCGKITQIG